MSTHEKGKNEEEENEGGKHRWYDRSGGLSESRDGSDKAGSPVNERKGASLLTTAAMALRKMVRKARTRTWLGRGGGGRKNVEGKERDGSAAEVSREIRST